MPIGGSHRFTKNSGCELSNHCRFNCMHSDIQGPTASIWDALESHSSGERMGCYFLLPVLSKVRGGGGGIKASSPFFLCKGGRLKNNNNQSRPQIYSPLQSFARTDLSLSTIWKPSEKKHPFPFLCTELS